MYVYYRREKLIMSRFKIHNKKHTLFSLRLHTFVETLLFVFESGFAYCTPSIIIIRVIILISPYQSMQFDAELREPLRTPTGVRQVDGLLF